MKATAIARGGFAPALLFAACAATGNPQIGDSRPLPPPSATQEKPAKAPEPAPAPATNAPAEPAKLVVGSVAGEPIEATEFLSRLWLRDSRSARESLEQIVFARLAMAEADRLGVVLRPDQVDQVYDRTIAALEERLRDSKARLTVDEHVRQNLEIEPEFYRARLREDAIVQLLAERAVRAWAFENERCDVLITEVRDEATVAKVRTALDAGRPFEEVATEFGAGEDEATHTTAMTIVRAENQELSRAAFATEVGATFGPLAQSGRWLFLLVKGRHQPLVGGWKEIGAEIERSLGADPVDDLDYVQWRAAMVRRYRVDLEPFLELVGGKKP